MYTMGRGMRGLAAADGRGVSSGVAAAKECGRVGDGDRAMGATGVAVSAAATVMGLDAGVSAVAGAAVVVVAG